VKKYYASVSEDIYVKANSEEEAIAKIKKQYQPLGVNLEIDIYDEEE
tara:strand:- start:4613 stop:4753 length:141 start_codon:yes stop_codon:yes gene_type:complete